MSKMVRVGMLLAGVWLIAAPTVKAADAPRVGEFETTFTDRGSNTAPADLAKRFGMSPQEAAPDYDLARVPLRVYVPADYNAATPMGLLVLLNNQQTDVVPPAVKPVADAAHLIFVAIKFPGAAPLQKAGWLLNIADNMQKQYAIDKNRIYLIDVEENNFVPYAVADVYTGHISTLKFIYNGRVIENFARQSRYFDPHDKHILEPGLIAIAKKRAYIFTVNPLEPSPQSSIEFDRYFVAKQMLHDGYQHARNLKADPADTKFPDIKGDWLKQSITWLDVTLQNKAAAATATPSPATAPTSPAATNAPAPAGAKPAEAPAAPSEEAARLLKVAKLYVNSGRKDIARVKLKEIIEKFPSDPAAATARKLLAQVGS